MPIEDKNESLDEMIRAIEANPNYRRADMDLDFLASDDVRAVRLQLEFLKPELILEEHGIQSTIVVLGGARILEAEAASGKVERAKRDLKTDPDNPELKQRLILAERLLAKSHYYEIARELGHIVGRKGKNGFELVIATGGGPGIMEAANRGAHEAGAPSIGLNIVLPHEQKPNPYITPELCFQFRYFALRKMHFLIRAKSLVVFPGGYGTLDEFFDMITLIQTGKVEPLPVILVGEEYWKHVFNLEYLIDEGTISPADIHLFQYAETAPEIWETIQNWYAESNRPLLSVCREI